ncbi:hypothetical protein [uncultured Prevotella sp.]|nr:hypothetical protein [uncultured Prevotella sp.]
MLPSRCKPAAGSSGWYIDVWGWQIAWQIERRRAQCSSLYTTDYQ